MWAPSGDLDEIYMPTFWHEYREDDIMKIRKDAKL